MTIFHEVLNMDLDFVEYLCFYLYEHYDTENINAISIKLIEIVCLKASNRIIER